jgi:hypothetical protein
MVLPPLSGVNGHFVNTDNSHLAYFGSTDTSRAFGLSGAIDNSLAASASRIRGGCWLKNRMSRRRRSSTKKKSLKKRRKSLMKRRKYKGGSCSTCSGTTYNPYANIQQGGLHSVTNCNNGYSTGGILSANNLGEANPVPYRAYGNFINPHYPNQRLSF